MTIAGVRSPFRFEGATRQAIHQLKYHNLRALARPLAELLGDYLATNPMPAEVLVPVPLHQKRLKERGYNQSHLLAQELGKLTALPGVTGTSSGSTTQLPKPERLPRRSAEATSPVPFPAAATSWGVSRCC